MKILYISYFYPPLGGPAALRNQKTVRYLSEMGAKITLITIDDIEYAYNDESLRDSCYEKKLIRTDSYDPMALIKKLLPQKKELSQKLYKKSPERLKLILRRLSFIDEKSGWLPPLYKAMEKELKAENYEIIYVSCGPFSSALPAIKLAGKYDKKLVVDYRDYWTLLSDYDLMGSFVKRKTSEYYEKKLLKRADLVITATKGIKEDLAEHFGMGIEGKSFVLYNGHDESDFVGIESAEPEQGGFTISYFGALYARRSLKQLYKAVKELNQGGNLPAGFRIRLYGSFNRETYKEIEESGIAELIEVVGLLKHREALKAMQEANALILIINSSSPRGTLTSKVFEYLRLGVPILGLVPAHKEAAELLTECGAKYLCPMESKDKIKECLQALFKEKPLRKSPSSALAKYERKAMVAQLYQRLQKLL